MIALILARGGSKGVPRKNIKMLLGYPLISYCIEAALSSVLITDVFVSSDDDEILEISKYYGAQVIKRPSVLAEDDSLDIDAFIHFCKKKSYTSPIVQLRATTPMVTATIIDNAINLYIDNKDSVSSLRSAHKMSESAFKFFVKRDFFWKPISNDFDPDQPRQKYPDTYVPNGCVDIVDPNFFMNNNSLYGENILAYETKFMPEIDTEDDFNYIEYLMSK